MDPKYFKPEKSYALNKIYLSIFRSLRFSKNQGTKTSRLFPIFLIKMRKICLKVPTKLSSSFYNLNSRETQFAKNRFFFCKICFFQSPLAKRLFAVDGVKGCFLGPDFVTVIRYEDDDSWNVLKAELFAVLTDFFDSNLPVINEDAMPNEDTVIYDDDVNGFESFSSIEKLYME